MTDNYESCIYEANGELKIFVGDNDKCVPFVKREPWKEQIFQQMSQKKCIDRQKLVKYPQLYDGPVANP